MLMRRMRLTSKKRWRWKARRIPSEAGGGEKDPERGGAIREKRCFKSAISRYPYFLKLSRCAAGGDSLKPLSCGSMHACK